MATTTNLRQVQQNELVEEASDRKLWVSFYEKALSGGRSLDEALDCAYFGVKAVQHQRWRFENPTEDTSLDWRRTHTLLQQTNQRREWLEKHMAKLEKKFQAEHPELPKATD